ncbi:MAG: hypothetical protein M1426_01065 [Patescibacteria group bacterium]|nr:hypothetical protein [Patescibacteria group bacterium]
MKETDRRPVLREKFGPGIAGQLAYEGILSGLPCEAFLDEQRTKACGRISDRTVDFDVAGHGDYFPVCSLEHSILVRISISKDLERQGHSTIFGENGFGRA